LATGAQRQLGGILGLGCEREHRLRFTHYKEILVYEDADLATVAETQEMLLHPQDLSARAKW
jgi:hypothetical protein